MSTKQLFCACLAAGTIFSQSVLAGTFYPITVNYDPEYTEDEIKDETKKIKDFPALLRIPENSPIYAVAGEGGTNLRFTDDTAMYDCPHEIDTWNPNGVSLVWVKVPKLQNGVVLRLYYDGTNSTQAADVWSSYAGVWHLNEPLDSSGKDIDPVDGVTPTTKFFDCASVVTNGVIGKGLGSAKGVGAAFTSKVYDDRNGHKCPIQVTNPSKFTVSCWVHVRDVAAWSFLFGPMSANNGNTGWKAEWTAAGGEKLRLCQYGGQDGRLAYFNTPALANGWGKIDAVWDLRSILLYVNGTLVGQKTDCTSDPTWYWTGWMGWGGCINSDGTIASASVASGTDFDECRIFDGAATEKRIAAEYATETDDTFLLIGGLRSEPDIPAGTVAQVGSTHYSDLAQAFSAAKADRVPVVLLKNGLTWTFQNPGDSISIKLGNFAFTAECGAGENYYLDVQYDPVTDVTTYTVKKQVQVVAMRNVAVYKELHTRDLADLLPKQVAGFTEDGQIAGMFNVAWDVEDITKYDYAGITPVPGLATVGGEKLPVTAYVRASLSYSDGYHNIAGEATNMVVTAPEMPNPDGGVYPLITNALQIGSSTMSVSVITNGLPALTVTGAVWAADSTPTFTNHGSGDRTKSDPYNPYVDVDFTWTEPKWVHRVEVICSGNSNQDLPEMVALSSEGQPLVYSRRMSNDLSRPRVQNEYNECFEFATPVSIQHLKVSFKEWDVNPVKGTSGRVEIQEILVWADGDPVDALEMSTSADLVNLEFDGKPVPGFAPGTMFYQYPGAKEVTAWAGDPNAGVTVLPELDGLFRVITLAEDGETTKTYLVLRRGYTMLLLR